MRKTSLKAFERVKKNLTPRQQLVITKIKSKPGSTIRDVSKALRTFPHCVSGRFSELLRLGLIKEAGIKRYKENNIPHTKWEVKIK